MNPSEESQQAIADAITRGDTIEAIKLYRQATGVGLKEAVDAVAAITRGVPTGPQQRAGNASMVQVEAALEQGRKIEAVKLYRNLTGLGLKESKEAVEAIQSADPQRFPATSGGCAKAACMLIAAGIGLTGLLWTVNTI